MPGQARPDTHATFLEFVQVQAFRVSEARKAGRSSKAECHYNGNLDAFQNCACDKNIETGCLVIQVPGKYPNTGT